MLLFRFFHQAAAGKARVLLHHVALAPAITIVRVNQFTFLAGHHVKFLAHMFQFSNLFFLARLI